MINFRKIVFPVACALIYSSCSCSNDIRKDYIIDGVFEGIDYINNESIFHMEIKKISENEYFEAKGINVVRDLVKEGFYQISLFSKKNKEEEITNYTFYNLKDAFNGEKVTRMFYEDDYKSCFRPFTTSNNKPLEREKCFYDVAFYGSDNVCKAGAYLRPID